MFALRWSDFSFRLQRHAYAAVHSRRSPSDIPTPKPMDRSLFERLEASVVTVTVDVVDVVLLASLDPVARPLIQ